MSTINLFKDDQSHFYISSDGGETCLYLKTYFKAGNYWIVRGGMKTSEHYKSDFELWVLCALLNIRKLEGDVMKYVFQYKKEGGMEDLLKAKWCVEQMINSGGLIRPNLPKNCIEHVEGFCDVHFLELRVRSIFLNLFNWTEDEDLKRALEDIERLISAWEGEHEEANKSTS